MLKKLAITAFALSMSAAYAKVEAGNPPDNLADKNKPATAAENAPAGYGDKSAAAEPMVGQKDTKKAVKKAKKASNKDAVASADRAPSGDTPAGYADKATTDKLAKPEQKDTLKAQQQPDAGLGAMAAAPAKSGAPAGYADQSSAAAGSQPQDTQKAQAK
jgi:hypothetical protein